MAHTTTHAREEPPCIWVLAGVLSYRLCDRGYDCEHCELYHALRGEAHLPAVTRRAAEPEEDEGLPPAEAALRDQVGLHLRRLFAGCKLYLDRRYSPGHFWLEARGPREALLGLDGQVLRLLYPIDEIVVPHAGVHLRRGEACGWVLRGRLAVPLNAPVSGTVEAVNGDYLQAVKAGDAAFGDEWLLRLTLDTELDDGEELYRAEEMLSFHLRKLRIVKEYLREALAHAAGGPLGPTLADGGTLQLNLEEVLGRERYERLVHEVFHMRDR